MINQEKCQLPCCSLSVLASRYFRMCENCGRALLAPSASVEGFVCSLCTEGNREKFAALLTEWSATQTNAERRALYANIPVLRNEDGPPAEYFTMGSKNGYIFIRRHST